MLLASESRRSWGLEDPVDVTSKPHGTFWHRFEVRCGPTHVYMPEDLKQLPANGRVRLEGELTQSLPEPSDRPTLGKVNEVRLDVAKGLLFDSYVWVPASVTDGVSAEPKGPPAKVLDLSRLFFEEAVLAVCGKENEKAAVSEVRHVCNPRSFPSRARPLRELELVLGNQLRIDSPRVLRVWDDAPDVEEIPVGEVTDGELLDEPADRRDLAAVAAWAATELRG